MRMQRIIRIDNPPRFSRFRSFWRPESEKHQYMKFKETPTNGLVKVTLGLLALGLTMCLQAQTPGKAEVRSIKGQASYSTAGGAFAPLKVGTILYSGTTIKTAPSSLVDLFLGNSAGFVRITENTTLALDKLAFTETGADTVVEVQLNLPDGTILGNVNKLSAASKYEVKVPNGVAGIRGTRFRISSSAYVVLLEGSLIMVYVPPNGQPTPYPLFGPPAQYFSPTEGVKVAPPIIRDEVITEFGPRRGEIPGPGELERQYREPKDRLPFIQPLPPKPSDTAPAPVVPPTGC